MPKSELKLSGKGYKSVLPGCICPDCGSRNTYYSCLNISWACMNCDELFTPKPYAPSVPNADVVPMPYGKILPDLRGSYNYNKDREYYEVNWLADIFFGYLEDTLCPNCGSDNVCCLDPTFNPEIESRGRWFCIACHDSWRYELEH